MKVLKEFETKLTHDEFVWCKKAVKENMKNIENAIDCYIFLKEPKDLIHSFKMLYRKDHANWN